MFCIRFVAWSFISICAVFSLSSCASTAWYENPPGMPIVVTPELDSPFLSGQSVTFTWIGSQTAENYDFHLFNAINSDITQYYNRELKPASVCRGESCSITLSVRLPESDKHAWRVRAGNIAGKSSWTRTLFTILPVTEPVSTE